MSKRVLALLDKKSKRMLHSRKDSPVKVGIGIVTYNRLDCLKQAIANIQEHTAGDYDLFVSDDGSTDGETVTWLEQSGVEFQTGPNRGVVYSKNRVITRFQDYDYIFIVEDDISIHKSGWNELYITAIKESGTQHFNFIPVDQRVTDPTKDDLATKVVATEDKKYPSFTMMSCNRLCGVMMVITKQVVEVCGGLDFRFRGYGWGHCEYTERIHRAGLSHFKYAAVRESLDYIGLLPVPHILSKDQVQHDIKFNRQIANECIRDRNLCRPFDVNDPGYLADRVLKD